MGRYTPVLLILIFAISCSSAPKIAEETTEEVEHEVILDVISEANIEKVDIPQEPEEEFNPVNVSREYYEATREDVQHFIEELNEIIKNQNYNAWKAALSDEYFEEISSPQNLLEISELPAMKTRRITLRTSQDYFTHVVIPSRANSRIDDIEFISLYRVKAFTINITRSGEENRLLLYNLEKTGDMWKIIN